MFRNGCPRHSPHMARPPADAGGLLAFLAGGTVCRTLEGPFSVGAREKEHSLTTMGIQPDELPASANSRPQSRPRTLSPPASPGHRRASEAHASEDAPTAAASTAAPPDAIDLPPPAAPTALAANPAVSAPLWRWDDRSGKLLFRSGLRGAVFGATKGTVAECLERGLFGLPNSRLRMVQTIDRERECTVLFLFNFSTRMLHGVFVPSGPAGYPLDPQAWTGRETESKRRKKRGRDGATVTTPFPAQVPVRRLGPPLEPIEERIFSPVMRYTDGHKFELVLEQAQVEQLVTLLVRRTKGTL